MNADLQWWIGVVISAALAISGLLATVFWKIMAQIDHAEKRLDDGDRELHARINRVREEMVHKRDFDQHVTSLRSEMQDMRREQREQNQFLIERLDKLLQANGGGQK